MNFRDFFVDSSKAVGNQCAKKIIDGEVDLKEVIDYAFLEDGQYSVRAAYAISIVFDKNPEMVKPFLNQIAKKLAKATDMSMRRNLLKMYIEKNYVDDDEAMGILIDKCFEWLCDSSLTPGLRVYAMDVIFNFTIQYPEFKNEFISALEIVIPDGSFGFKSRAERRINELNNKIKIK